MNTKQIYEEYMIPQNLQDHMLRVASLAKILLDHWSGPSVDQAAVIQACIFHDIAKPMNFDLAKQAQFGMSQTEIDNLHTLQERLKSSYGDDEHHATVAICKEIGCSPKAVKIVNNLEWSYIPALINDNDLESLIPIYVDMRIGPNGILTLKERLNDLKSRTGEDQHQQNGIQLETLISNNVSIDLNEISDELISSNFPHLENLTFTKHS
jgi:putative nucleotidyltransferase with HDIG domain